MILLDTNICIYLANQTLSGDALGDEDIAYASVTRIEALGFHSLSVGEEHQLIRLFNASMQYDLSETVIVRAIAIRQIKRMGLGDAIIAAMALEYDCELWTANTADFEHIQELKLVNPLKRS
ncbi:MAG TPA: type II toxin-antitoxin system VapC family toxin [Candidatus Saccharimonadales bacterium]|jgi:hypothetical protein